MSNAENSAFIGGGGGGGSSLIINAGDGIIVEKIGVNVEISADVDNTTIGFDSNKKLKALPSAATTYIEGDGIEITQASNNVTIGVIADETTVTFDTDSKMKVKDGVFPLVTRTRSGVTTTLNNAYSSGDAADMAWCQCTDLTRKWDAATITAIDASTPYCLMHTKDHMNLNSSDVNVAPNEFRVVNHLTTPDVENTLSLNQNGIDIVTLNPSKPTTAQSMIRLSKASGVQAKHQYQTGLSEVVTTGNLDGTTLTYNTTTHKISASGGGGGDSFFTKTNGVTSSYIFELTFEPTNEGEMTITFLNLPILGIYEIQRKQLIKQRVNSLVMKV
jgi:hypothetical protein